MKLARLALALIFVSACAPAGTRVPFAVVSLGDDPFFAGTATAIAVTVERGGVRDPASTTRFAPSDRTLTLPPFPFGTDYSIVVETEISGLVLARGRSFPFAVDAAGADRVPDVSLGVLGRFAPAASADASDPFVLTVPSAEGALLVSRLGIARFLAHGADGRPNIGARASWPSTRVGASFVGLGVGVLAVGGAAPGATLVGPNGQILAELSGADVRAVDGIALVAIDASSVLAIGGATSAGMHVEDVVRIAWDGTALSATALSPLPAMRADARATLVTVHDGSSRVVVIDGASATGPLDDVVLVDPSDRNAPISVPLATPVTRAAICALDTGLVLLAGGSSMGNVTGTVTILVVQPSQTPVITALSPPPPPLFRPRLDAAAVPLGPGLALVVGGVDASGAAVGEAEIVEVSLEFITGNVVLTGTLRSTAIPTAATRLSDHTVLVAEGSALSLYFSPRGE